MGLDASHDCWHGAYSAFARWRLAIAEAAGYPISERDPFDSGSYTPGYWQDAWEDIPNLMDKLMGEWDTPPDDPLLILLIHSDCDGVIKPTHATFLAERLERLLPSLPDEDYGGHIGGLHAKTKQFIAGLRWAAEEGEEVEFC